jgi:hypothetical protein
MTMGTAITVLIALVAYIVLMRWVLPRFGIPT